MANPVVNAVARFFRPRPDGQTGNAVLAAVLIAIILAGIGVAVYVFLRPSEDRAMHERARRPIDFQCERCGHKFSITSLEYQEQWVDVDPSTLPESSRHKVHCLKCKGRFCAKLLDEPLEEGARRLPGRAAPGPVEGRP